MVLTYVAHRGVFQVLDGADGGLRTVGVVGEQGCHHGFVGATAVLCHAYVFLLVNGFQLGVEKTQHEVLETVALHFGPVFELVGGNVLNVHGVVVGGEGVGAGGADGGHRFVVLVGDGNLRGEVRKTVYFVVDGGTSCGVVEHAVSLVEVFDFLDVERLFLPVLGAELVAALEKHVLQIVGKACGLLGVVFGTGAHCYVGLDTRGVLINAHKHFKPVVQGVFAHLQRVVGVGLVLVLLCYGRSGKQRHGNEKPEKEFYFSHCFTDVYFITY